MLSYDRLLELSSGSNVKTQSVIRFFSEIKHLSKFDSEQKLELDALCLNWNIFTVRAIQQGIEEYYGL
jgi:hypothetical protein